MPGVANSAGFFGGGIHKIISKCKVDIQSCWKGLKQAWSAKSSEPASEPDCTKTTNSSTCKQAFDQATTLTGPVLEFAPRGSEYESCESLWSLGFRQGDQTCKVAMGEAIADAQACQAIGVHDENEDFQGCFSAGFNQALDDGGCDPQSLLIPRLVFASSGAGHGITPTLPMRVSEPKSGNKSDSNTSRGVGE